MARPPTDPGPDDAIDRAYLRTLTLLYVEDDGITRTHLGRFLRRRLGAVFEAGDGAEGLTLFEAHRPALVVTDIRMPVVDGLALTEAIHQIDPSTPVIVTTAFEQVEYLRRAIDAGVERYVAKPVDPDRLDAALVTCARRLRAEAALARAHHEALDRARAHARETICLLAGGMAHDFNNLLQPIIGNVEWVAARLPPGDPAREDLEAALDAAHKAAALGGSLRTLAWGGFDHAPSSPLGPTVRAAVDAAIAGSGTQATLALHDDLPEVPHDPALLGRAIGQLAQNAREAMHDGGALEIAARVRELDEAAAAPLPAGAYVELTVTDHGPGVPAELLASIFDPYFTTKPRGAIRGVGLGLALCASIVRQHRGELTCASPAGEGATFTLRLPLASTRGGGPTTAT